MKEQRELRWKQMASDSSIKVLVDLEGCGVFWFPIMTYETLSNN